MILSRQKSTLLAGLQVQYSIKSTPALAGNVLVGILDVVMLIVAILTAL